MEGKRFLRSIRLQNLLSYGPQAAEIELGPLNVLIGPNGSGKSNLIAAIDLLRSAPDDLAATIGLGGGVDEWLWKGEGGNGPIPIARIEVSVEPAPLRYSLGFTRQGSHFHIVAETVEGTPAPGWSGGPYYLYENESGQVHLRPIIPPSGPRFEQTTPPTYGTRPALNQLRGPSYPEVTYLAENFSSIGLFRTAGFGPFDAAKQPQSTDLPDGFVREDGGNLSLVIHRLQQEEGIDALLLEKLRLLVEDVERISTPLKGGTMQVALRLRGLRGLIPAARLSDGTLRFLSLLTILCDPNPPPLVCIEEPELGLHPDLIRSLGALLIDAAQRTQLIVTTHSDLLVSALGDAPESVVVCERNEQGTELRRLDPSSMKAWLERYSLGDLWLKGEIGGTRW